MAKKVKRLYRAPKRDSVIAGVCSGIANYFGIDPVIVRMIWFLVIFAYGSGILAYIIAWILIPRK
jgi:phage shock protein C